MENSGIIFGRNTVLEAIKSGRSIDAVLVAPGMDELGALAKRKGLVVKEVPRVKLDEMCREAAGSQAVHQGIAALIPGVEYVDVESILERAEERGEPPFIIALDGITDPHNLGAIVRSAEVFGAHGVIIARRRCASMTPTACKAACGAEEHILVARVGNLVNTLEMLKKKGVWTAAADMEGDLLQKQSLSGGICIVIGSEGEGVSRLVKERCDMRLKINMVGKVASLNASAAAAVVMYEKCRQDDQLKGK